MKKLFLVLMLVSLVALMAVPAMAGRENCDVSVDANVYKNAAFCEFTSVFKDFDLFVNGKFSANQWAEACIYECQTNANGEWAAAGIQGHPGSSVTTTGSGTYSGKIDGDIKGYVEDKDNKDHDPRSYCKDDRKDRDKNKDPLKAELKATESGTFSFTATTVTAAVPTVYFVSKDTIDSSFNNGFTGIAQVNQSSGSGNNQGNDLAAALTDPRGVNHDDKGVADLSLGKYDPRERKVEGGVATTEVAIGQTNYDNEVAATAAIFSDTISNSFNDFQGVAQVNQAAGFANNQKNAVAIAANLNSKGAVAMSDAFLTQSNCQNSAAYAGDVQISATISKSFNGGTGLAQVNQSPGSMNNQANVVAVSYSGFNTNSR